LLILLATTEPALFFAAIQALCLGFESTSCGIISLPFGFFGAALWLLAVGIVPQLLLALTWLLRGKK